MLDLQLPRAFSPLLCLQSPKPCPTHLYILSTLISWFIDLATSQLHPPFLFSLSLNSTRPANSHTIPPNCLPSLHVWMAQDCWIWLRKQCSPASVGAFTPHSNTWPNPLTNNPNFQGFKLSSSSLRLSYFLSFSNNWFALRKTRGLNKCSNSLLHLCI